ncbi:MAG: methionine--tRNA ligase [Deferribacteraceae bacterium]|jgi:methionyl-tRNA synthetase|nr:methionine--tRNA ligase [Deferribacteraceae bacterium]
MSFYVTTPIYYVNDVPHLGHTYTTVAADTIARFKRMCGEETFFLTGTDEHGQKIEQAAAKKKLTPKELADNVVGRYYKLWEKLGITNNKFVRTTDEYHKTAVQAIFKKLQDNGDIYEGEYEGWYCTPCEAFWTESQLREDNLCPDCGRPTAKMKEPTYFFRMSKYQDALLKHIEAHPDFIKPESRRNEIISFINEGLRDLSVSRVTFSWGVKVPNDPKHVIYVWIDALVNYLTALGYTTDDDALFKKFWPATVQLVGKDILRFHTVYWPTMLMSLGLPLPKSVFAHGWWTVEGQKMSKSLGNVVDPFYVTDKFGIDQVRYFLLREVTFGLDGDFSYKALIHRINGDLANDLGNLTTRTLGMITRYFDGVIPAAGEFQDTERAIHTLIADTAKSYVNHMNDLAFNKALLSVWELVGALNRYIDSMQPWALAKDEAQKDRLGTVLYTAVDGLRALSYFIAPFMPESAVKLRSQIGINAEIAVDNVSTLEQSAKMPAGGKLGEVVALFPRIDEKEMMAAIMQDQSKDTPKLQEAVSTEVEQIGIADFEKIRIIAGKIEAAEKVAKSEKLLRLSVNDGVGVRTIVSGIAKSYEPQDLVGKTVAILENLKPAKLMGIESRGMILAAFDGERHHVVILPDSVPAGTKIK